MDCRRPLLRSMATSGWNWIARSPTAFSGHLPSYWKILVLVNQYLWLICSSLAPILSPFGCLLIVFSGRSYGPNIKSISYSQEKEFWKSDFKFLLISLPDFVSLDFDISLYFLIPYNMHFTIKLFAYCEPNTLNAFFLNPLPKNFPIAPRFVQVIKVFL